MAKEEIERLRRELDSLKTRQPSGGAQVLPPPPPQPRPRTITPVPAPRERTPVPDVPRKTKPVSENPALDIFKRLKQSVDQCKWNYNF